MRISDTEQVRSLKLPSTQIFTSGGGLDSVNWDFAERSSGDALETLHPYPAKFIREIPRALISHLTPPSGTAVFDPFCGSGTTLVEAQRAGLPSIGVDLNPIACLMARVKTSSLQPGLTVASQQAVASALYLPAPQTPKIPNVGHWFDEPIQEALARLAAAIQKSEEKYRDGLRLALSSIIVRVSRQESDTRYAAIDKNVTFDDVFSLFLAAAEKMDRALSERDYKLSTCAILERDTLQINASELSHPIGLVVTSPPYPNAYEYWLYHKYRMFWLGFDPIAVKELEIGARAHFFKKNHHTPEHFARQMGATLDLIDKVLVSEGRVCFVVGRSIIHGRQIDNADTIAKLGYERGYRVMHRTERRIAPTRKAFNLSHANIKTETILVLGRS